MQVLFDQGTPAPLRDVLVGHHIATAYACGWSRLKNGELLDAAESKGFDVLVTTDKNLRYQQNLAGRRIAVVVLSTTSWPRISVNVNLVHEALERCGRGTYAEVPL